MRSMSRTCRTACLVLAMALASAAFFDAQAVTLRRGSFSEPRSLDPHKVTGTTGAIIVYDMFEGLLTTDAKGNITGGLAQDWNVSGDGLTYTFTLRDDLAWSDGTALTAADVVYSYRRLVDPETASPLASVVSPIANARDIVKGAAPASALGVTAVDRKTVSITIDQARPYFPLMLLTFANSVVPQHVIEAHGREWTKAAHIATSGAYVLKERISNTSVTVVKNEHYHAAAETLIDEVIYFPIENGAASLKRYRAGELDVTLSFPPSQIDWLRENRADDLHILPALALSYILINHDKHPFDDIRIRKALSLAIDRDIIVDRLLNDGSRPAYNIVPPATPDYGENSAPFKADRIEDRIAQAKDALERAGYGAGRPLEVDFKVGVAEESKRVAVAYQGFWKRIGVEARIQEFDTSSLVRAARAGDYELMRYSYFATYADPMSFLSLLQSDSSTNLSGYASRAFDEMIEKANDEADPVTRFEKLRAAEQFALGEFPIIPTIFKSQKHLVSRRVKGWIDNPRNVYFARYLNVIE